MHVSPLRPRLGRPAPLSLALCLPLAAFALLLGATAPAAQQLTITGIEFEYIDGGTWVDGDQVEVYVEPHAFPGPVYNCRWRFPDGTTQIRQGRGIDATTMACDLLEPQASTFGDFEIEVTHLGSIWSEPWPGFTYDCEPGRAGPDCAACTCASQETALGFCNENLTGDGQCNQCVGLPPIPYRCGPDCRGFCEGICSAPDLCDQSTCTCLGCDDGWWGETCLQRCPTGCAGADDPCDRVTGDCFACDPGLYGEQCTLTAPPVPALSGRAMLLLCAALAVSALWSARRYFRESRSGGGVERS